MKQKRLNNIIYRRIRLFVTIASYSPCLSKFSKLNQQGKSYTKESKQTNKSDQPLRNEASNGFINT